MTEQSALFDATPAPVHPWQRSTRLPDPGVATEGWAHRASSDTERAAARLVAPRTGTWRSRVLREIASCLAGATDWELHKALGGNLYTVAPRRKELVEMGWIRDSGERRPTNNGASAIVWTMTDQGRAEYEAGVA